MTDVRYRCQGGPRDGETVAPPPAILEAATDALADALEADGAKVRRSGLMLASPDHPGGYYTFSPDTPDVLVWVANS